MGEAVRRHVGSGASRHAAAQNRTFRNHLDQFLEFSVSRRAFDASAALDHGVVAAGPVHGVGGSGAEQRQQPVHLDGGGRGGNGANRLPGRRFPGRRFKGGVRLFGRRGFRFRGQRRGSRFLDWGGRGLFAGGDLRTLGDGRLFNRRRRGFRFRGKRRNRRSASGRLFQRSRRDLRFHLQRRNLGRRRDGRFGRGRLFHRGRLRRGLRLDWRFRASRRRKNHARQLAFDELGRLGAAPSARPLAAETRVGEQAERGFHRIEPAPAGRVVQEGHHGPQTGSGTEFQARRSVALAGAREPVHGGAPADVYAERSGPAGGNQALAGAIHAPVLLVQPAARQQRLHDGQGHEARALPAHARRQKGRRHGRPDGARRNHETDLVQEWVARTEAHRRSGGARRLRQPLVERAEPRHGARNRGVQRIAVVDRVHAIARPRVGPDAPGAGGTELHQQSRVHYSSRTNEKADSATAV